MYTRSFPKRSLPPDYGGTALTVRLPEQSSGREAIASPPPDSGNRRPRRPPFGREEMPPRPPIAPPFGGVGLHEESPPSDDEEAFTEPSAPLEHTASLPVSTEERPSFLGGLLESASLKSDDLLLLGLALLLISDKDRPEGESCADALLLLAMLYVSGIA